MNKFVPCCCRENTRPSLARLLTRQHEDWKGKSGRSLVAVHVATRRRRRQTASPLPNRPPAGRTARENNPKPMAWRPYENLIDGELDNRIPGKVTGWMRFCRNGEDPLKVTFDLEGDFHEDIRGTNIRLSNSNPSDRHAEGATYMDGFDPMQRGVVGDITAGLPAGIWTPELAQRLMQQHELQWDEAGIQGRDRRERKRQLSAAYAKHIADRDLYYPYVTYPYIEWYAANGRVVLELDPSQVTIVDMTFAKEKSPAELNRDDKRRSSAMMSFLGAVAESFFRENRDHERRP